MNTMDHEQEILADMRTRLFDALGDASVADIDAIGPYDTENEWSLTPEVLRFLAALVGRFSPQHVIEFGAGISTRVLAMAASRLQHPCAISSIDHDPEFGAAALPAALAHPGAEFHVRLQIAPLVAREIAGNFVPVYYIDPEKMASDHPADIVIIDGPPDSLGGRAGTLFQIMDFIRPGSIVLLDDALRESEQRACRLWSDVFGEAIEIIMLPGFKKGLAAILVRQPVPAGDLWSYRNREIWRDLESVVPLDAPCILVDDNQFQPGSFCNRTILPFLEKDGQYWGTPANDAEALWELARMKNEGARFIAFARSAFWWLDHYSGFLQDLRTMHRCVLENERVVIFDLR